MYSYYFSALFTETNSSWLISESIKALEIKTYMVSIFFLIIDLYVLITVVTAQIFILTAELAIPAGAPTKETKAGNEAQPVTLEVKISKCST